MLLALHLMSMLAQKGRSMHSLKQTMEEFIGHKAFPCVGAKTALSRAQIEVFEGHSLLDTDDDEDLLRSLQTYIQNCRDDDSGFRSFVAIFPDTPSLSEEKFESALWQKLNSLHQLDDAPWDPAVSDDPDDNDFSFSLGGKAFYIVGMHPAASRPARRFRHPALVFNLHEQFERLRADGRYHTMRQIIRRRDHALAGSVNPMLLDFGTRSEAIQYSGRAIEGAWSCPFHPKKVNDHVQ
jgi:FPC/CPF motif-containing protein YcgG